MLNTLSPAVKEQKSSSFQEAWARVRDRNARRRALRQAFIDAEYELATVTLEEIHELMLQWPLTAERAVKVIVNLVKLNHPSVGLMPLVKTVPQLSAKSIRYAVKGQRTLTSNFDMNDLPYAGMSVDLKRRVKYTYHGESQREARSAHREGDEYAYAQVTKVGARQVLKQRKIALLERYKFTCPGPCGQVKLKLRAWVVGKAVRDKRWKRPVCRSCWLATQPPRTAAAQATSKDPRIPVDGIGKCPRCEREVKKRAHWRVSASGEAICLWCRRKEPKGSTAPPVDVKVSAKILERRALLLERHWRTMWLALVKYICPVCNLERPLRQQWRFEDRMAMGFSPCCFRCDARWKSIRADKGDTSQGDWIKPDFSNKDAASEEE